MSNLKNDTIKDRANIQRETKSQFQTISEQSESMCRQSPSKEAKNELIDSVRNNTETIKSDAEEKLKSLESLYKPAWKGSFQTNDGKAIEEFNRFFQQPLTTAREAEFKRLLSEFKGVDGHLITPEHQEELMSMIRALATTEVVPS